MIEQSDKPVRKRAKPVVKNADTVRQRIWDLSEKVVILGVALSPIFILASSIDSDEIAKSSLGFIGGAVVMIAGTVLRSGRRVKPQDDEPADEVEE